VKKTWHHSAKEPKELDVSPPSVRSPGFALSALWQVAPVARFENREMQQMETEPLPIHYPLFTSCSFLVFFVCLIFV
jgi:hypothetical protein